MWRDLKWALLVALVPAAAGFIGCGLNDASAPALQGPSELGISVEMRANPFLLISDGMSSSVIEAVVRDPNGQRLQGVTILFDIRVTGASTIRGYLDLGVLAGLGAPRPIAGGPESTQVAATSGADGVARAVYWAPYRTDQENDIIVTIIGRPLDVDYRAAVARTVDIFLRAADRPQFAGTNFCNFVIEPVQQYYYVGQQIFFTATQVTGPTNLPIARYEWDFSDSPFVGSGYVEGRTAGHVFTIPGVFSVYLYTTEAITGLQTACSARVSVSP